MKTTNEYTQEQIDDLSYSDDYSDYIMNNANGDRCICNGDTLLQAMEEGYLFDEFLASKGTF